MFVDKVKVKLIAGKGGDGIVSWRREKFVERGGPDGGDGGHGGDIVVKGSSSENTLADFRYKKEISAKPGQPGGRQKRHGKSAPSTVLKLPIGTVVMDKKGQTIADLTEPGQEVLVAKGGRGGYGNAHFTSSRRRAPKARELGEPGESMEAVFELKMIADVGLVGLPNAGKSTLLSKLSNARPEIADYPFTTLSPHLGVVDLKKTKSLLFADIPGLIEGASQGKGLGDEFLRHVERTSVLIHLIDAYQGDIVKAYKTIQAELKAYKVDLSRRPQIVAVNKTEGLSEDMVEDVVGKLRRAVPSTVPVVAISGLSGRGLDGLLELVSKLVEKNRQASKKTSASSRLPVLRLGPEEDSWHITKKGKKFIIKGTKIERFAARTDFKSEASVERLRDIMRKSGITRELERRQIDPGDIIQIGASTTHQLEY